MPLPEFRNLDQHQNRLIYDEVAYDKEAMATEYTELCQTLIDEQMNVFNVIMDAVAGNDTYVYFLYGYGGTGKTHLWKTRTTVLRSKEDIVLTNASSGIASLLLYGGRTAHSRFCIPLRCTEDTMCTIKPGSELAELVVQTKLIIWDEAPMVNRFCFEALDRTFRDILEFINPNSCNQPFGGKVIVFGGDFRQILPVIPKGTRADIVSATLTSSYLWDSCRVLKLMKNTTRKTGFDSVSKTL